MANKKCPKCGEDNPAEAVMCWACYTPLTGGAVAATATAGAIPMAGAGARAATLETEDEKKKLDPKMLVVGGLLVFGVLVAVVMNSGIFGGTVEDPIVDNSIASTGSTGMTTSIPSTTTTVTTNTSINQNPSNTTAVPPPDSGYLLVSSPDPRSDIGTVGVFQNNVSGQQAATLAKFVRSQYARSRWKGGMQVFVFSDKTGADQFRTYQIKRRGASLSSADFANLASSNVWASSPACLMPTGGQDRLFVPSSNPNSWWGHAVS